METLPGIRRATTAQRATRLVVGAVLGADGGLLLSLLTTVTRGVGPT